MCIFACADCVFLFMFLLRFLHVIVSLSMYINCVDICACGCMYCMCCMDCCMDFVCLLLSAVVFCVCCV